MNPRYTGRILNWILDTGYGKYKQTTQAMQKISFSILPPPLSGINFGSYFGSRERFDTTI